MFLLPSKNAFRMDGLKNRPKIGITITIQKAKSSFKRGFLCPPVRPLVRSFSKTVRNFKKDRQKDRQTDQ